ncbi:MAG: carbonate dehydratase [Phycisphaerae bacterium]
MGTDATNHQRQIDVARAIGGWRAEPSGKSPGRDAAAAVAVRCSHCASPVPASLVEADQPEQFCCHGCRAAYAVIHSCGLERYYRLRDQAVDGAAAGAPVRSTGRRYSEFDDDVFARLYCRDGAAGAKCVELVLEGVHCSACVWLLEKLPSLMPGVVEARLDLRRATLGVTWMPGAVKLSSIAALLDSLGYRPHPARDMNARRLREAEDRRYLVRMAVAGACAGNAMLMALALYAGLFDWMESSHVQLMRWASMVVTVVSLMWPGRVFFTSAWAALRTRTAHLDVPIALALAGGGVWSVVSTIRGTGEIYFDTLSVLVFLLLVGRFIQHRQQRWASDAVELLFSLTPTCARRVAAGTSGAEVIEDVPVESLAVGDIVEVRAGDSFPADGEVVRGDSLVDQSLLTGESRPVPLSNGAPAVAGAVNVTSTLRVRVSATGEHTRAGRLMRMVEECSQRRAPIVRLADRISSYFTVGMIGAAAVTLVAWLFIEPGRALENAVALLVVTCPCALGLATPLVLTVALGRAARAGMLIKGGDVIQRLSTPGRIFLDKTGTLTFGRLTLARWEGDESVKPLVAAIEAGSNHPVAVALARDLGGSDVEPSRSVQTIGSGVQGEVDGRQIAVGSPAFVRSRGAADPRGLWPSVDLMIREGLTPVVVEADGEIAAVAGLGDQVRPDSLAAVRSLSELGWDVEVLSGDHPSVAASIGRSVGVAEGKIRGGVSPEQKLSVVRESSEELPTVMVGDGVNDAASLAAAGVGIAVHGGAEASLAAADVYLNEPGLRGVADLIEGSRRTMRVIWRNLGVSVVYNLTAGALAVTGMMNPLIAAIVMPVSSLTVLVLAFRSRSFGGSS